MGRHALGAQTVWFAKIDTNIWGDTNICEIPLQTYTHPFELHVFFFYLFPPFLCRVSFSPVHVQCPSGVPIPSSSHCLSSSLWVQYTITHRQGGGEKKSLEKERQDDVMVESSGSVGVEQGLGEWGA